MCWATTGSPTDTFGVTTPQSRAWRLLHLYGIGGDPTQQKAEWTCPKPEDFAERPASETRSDRPETDPETGRRSMYDLLDLGDSSMGGIGSGARRTTNIGNVEDTLALDIRALRRLGALRHGECVITPVRWAQHALIAPSGRLRIDLSEPEDGGTMMVTAMMPGGQVDQRIAIELVPAPLGGHRCYFICPITGDRCEVIYYVAGRFASRVAQRLSYAVQSMDEVSRARRSAVKVRRRLHDDGVPRPRGRNRIDLVERLHDADWKARTLYHARLCEAAGRSGARRMPEVTRG